MELAVKILEILALIVPILIGSGALVKYLPFLRNLSNQLIPLLNSAVAFFMLFATPTASAGIFDSLGGVLSFPAKAAASVLLSYLSSAIHDRFLKGWLPAGPRPTN